MISDIIDIIITIIVPIGLLGTTISLVLIPYVKEYINIIRARKSKHN